VGQGVVEEGLITFGSLVTLQTELNRRREQEIMKLKKDLETVVTEREMSEAALRKRHQDAVNELSQQLENNNRKSTKYVTRIVAILYSFICNI